MPLVLQFWSKTSEGEDLEGTSVVLLAQLLKVTKHYFLYWHILTVPNVSLALKIYVLIIIFDSF